MAEKLFSSLQEYSKSDYYPFHMPGHKRFNFFSGLPYDIDLTEIPGFDDLHHPEGMIRELEEEMTNYYDSAMTKILVNGSSCGILAAINSVICHYEKSGEKGCDRTNDTANNHLLIARNCHKSVFHALAINHDIAGIRYILPQISNEWGMCGAILPKSVEEAFLAEEQAFGEGCVAAFVMVSPTYEGVVSDVEEIARICHAHGAYLIVDEAHGAHFPFIGKQLKEYSFENEKEDTDRSCVDEFVENGADDRSNNANLSKRPFARSVPYSAIELGADFVIQSYHKTLPAMTQTAVIHVGHRVSDFMTNRLRYQLGIFQSSSPSYVLMASISQCFAYMKSEAARDTILSYVNLMNWFYEEVAALELSELKVLQLEDVTSRFHKENEASWCFDWDFSKVVIAIRNRSYQISECNGSAVDCDSVSAECNGTATGVRYDGEWLEKELRERFHLQMEMATPGYVIAMTTIADRREGFERLLEALRLIDRELNELRMHTCELNPQEGENLNDLWIFSHYIGDAVDKPAVCMNLPKQDIEFVEIRDAVGRISCDFVYMYPPGIPFVVPGERITKNAANLTSALANEAYTIYGLDSESRIRVKR